jgi:tRNA A-37 threonylcarbamoyl transferase component Bud32
MFKREFDNIARFERLNIPALAAAYYGERSLNGNREAILITRSLEGFVAMDQWYQSLASGQPLTATAEGQAVFDQVAQLFATMHGAGLAHWGTYPHHIFVRPEGSEARFIDLERARWQPPYRRRSKDLDVFYRHAGYMHKQDLDYLLAQYFAYSGKVWRVDKLRREINQRIAKAAN